MQNLKIKPANTIVTEFRVLEVFKGEGTHKVNFGCMNGMEAMINEEVKRACRAAGYELKRGNLIQIHKVVIEKEWLRDCRGYYDGMYRPKELDREVIGTWKLSINKNGDWNFIKI